MRYIGSKSKLLKYLNITIKDFCKLKQGSIMCDVFAGTGAVGDQFQNDFAIIANDNLFFSYCINKAKLCLDKYLFDKLDVDPFLYFNKVITTDYTNGYCYNTFSPNAGRQYFSNENAKKN